MHFYRSSLCWLTFTDHMFAVCRGASSALLCTAQSGLHLFHLLLQHLLLLGQLLVTVGEDTEVEVNQTLLQLMCAVYLCMHMDRTLWPDCVAPRSPLLASGCCPPCPPPPASASELPPQAFGCSSEGRQHNTPALMSHWGKKHTNTQDLNWNAKHRVRAQLHLLQCRSIVNSHTGVKHPPSGSFSGWSNKWKAFDFIK